MAKFSGPRNLIVYSANGRWRCSCGRTFTKSKKCLQCGDKLPHWIRDGKITMDVRNRMTEDEYATWMEDALVNEAADDIKNWLGGP